MRALSLMESTTQTSVPTPDRAPDWRMWVASAAMMLCSWLSYVDRQVLAVLSPTILQATGDLPHQPNPAGSPSEASTRSLTIRTLAASRPG